MTTLQEVQNIHAGTGFQEINQRIKGYLNNSAMLHPDWDVDKLVDSASAFYGLDDLSSFDMRFSIKDSWEKAIRGAEEMSDSVHQEQI